jgi:hypothetical protein
LLQSEPAVGITDVSINPFAGGGFSDAFSSSGGAIKDFFFSACV